DTWYYRYHISDSSTSYAHALKFVFGPQSYARLAAAVGNPFTASDAAVQTYADKCFAEYVSASDPRVQKLAVQGAGCPSCSGGRGTFPYINRTTPNYPAGNTNFNIWKNQTEERQFAADGVTVLYLKTVFTNLGGEVLLEALRDPVTGNEWSHYYQYD